MSEFSSPLLDSVIVGPRASHKSSVIWLHGLGADGHDFEGTVDELALPKELGVRFIFPHAPMRAIEINGGLPMRAWFNLYGLNLELELNFDNEGVRKSYHDISALIEQELSLGIPVSNIILAGFSQGGTIALYTGLKYPQQLGGILGLSTFLPLHLIEKEDTRNKNMPIFMAHGTSDTMVALERGEASKNAIAALGYFVDWQTYSMDHSVCREETQAIANWLKAVLKP